MTYEETVNKLSTVMEEAKAWWQEYVWMEIGKDLQYVWVNNQWFIKLELVL